MHELKTVSINIYHVHFENNAVTSIPQIAKLVFCNRRALSYDFFFLYNDYTYIYIVYSVVFTSNVFDCRRCTNIETCVICTGFIFCTYLVSGTEIERSFTICNLHRFHILFISCKWNRNRTIIYNLQFAQVSYFVHIL